MWEIPLLITVRLGHLLSRRPRTAAGILIVNTCIGGDFMVTLPALCAFIASTQEPYDLVVSPTVASIAVSLRGVRSVYTARSMYQRAVEERVVSRPLPGEYRHILVMRISPEAVRIIRSIRSARLTTYALPFLRYWMHVLASIARKSEVRQWRDVNYEIVGVTAPARVPGFEDLFQVTREVYERVRRLPGIDSRRMKIILHPGSGWHVKLWDNVKWAEVIQRIDALGEFEFIVIGAGEYERKSFQEIQTRCGLRLHSFIDNVDLNTVLLMMRLSDFFIGIDSGPRNMAHLADLRSVTLLGPAPKNFMPDNRQDIVLDRFTIEGGGQQTPLAAA